MTDIEIGILLTPSVGGKGVRGGEKTKVHGKKDIYYLYLHEVLSRPIKGRGELIARKGGRSR